MDSNFPEKNNSQILIYQTEGGKTKMNVSKKKTLRHIKELIKTGEGYHLEFKKSLDKSFAEEVCAFANSSGGKILLGIADDGKSSGIKTDNVLLSRIQDHSK